MYRLLTDEELKKQVDKIIENAGIQRISFREARDELSNLIRSQKKAYAEYVIGEPLAVFDEPDVHIAQMNQAKNDLIAEQQERNKQ